MADEYMVLVYRLFYSREPYAIVMEREQGSYADWRKVHSIHFEGEFFKCRWPLNTVPSPQGTDIDFSRFSLDQPLPRIATNGEQGSLDKFTQWETNKTLRRLPPSGSTVALT